MIEESLRMMGQKVAEIEMKNLVLPSMKDGIAMQTALIDNFWKRL